MDDKTSDKLTDAEFTSCAQSASNGVMQILMILDGMHQTAFEGRVDAEHDRAAIISGALDAVLRYAMNPESDDDEHLRTLVVGIIDDIMPQIRFNMISAQARSVGEGRA